MLEDGVHITVVVDMVGDAKEKVPKKGQMQSRPKAMLQLPYSPLKGTALQKLSSS